MPSAASQAARESGSASLRGVAAPVAKDQELELHVDSLAYGGNGVARLNGFVVFVRRGLPGDRVRARVTKVKRNHAEALAVEVLQPGPQRVDAPCVHYPACGGCQFHYRNKVEYSFTETPNGPALGFHKAGRWDEVLEIERCWISSDLSNALRDAVRDWARAEKLEPYDQAEHTGYLRHLVIREGRNTRQALVQLVTAPGERFDRDELVEVLRRFPEVRSIHWAVNESQAEVTNLPTMLLWGDEAIEEELCGLRFRVRPNAFLQTNTAMAERLYELAFDAAALTGEETVYDLYCGIGTIGLAMASQALTIWGVVVDPPRAGLAGKALRRVGEAGAPRLVYVSCNPTTLAGDVKRLVADYGYRLERARPVDMFPHTPHVETVALLRR